MTYPQAPQMPFAPQSAPPRPAKFGALAWTALILGIVGIVGSPIIFLNNLTAVAAAVGLILGVIAIFGTKKALAVIGVLLCVGGIAFTVAAQAKTVEDLDKVFNGTANQGQVSDGGADQPAAAKEEPSAAEAPTWGKRYTWSSGLAVAIAPPVACEPGQYAAPQDIQRAAKFTVTIINGTAKPFETAVLSFGGDA